ncbi:hypothetical protein LTR33_002354, partial [Friedmanniomyces endolithicus]
MAAASSAVGQPQSQPQMPSQSISSPGQATAPTALGKYVRMRHLQASELPAHPAIAPLQSSGTPPNLHQFLVEVLEEAEAFMIGYLPLKFKVKSSSKSSPPATASVELLTHEINAADIPKEARTAGAGSAVETWFARTSVHENAAKEGTASWEEFDRG